METLAAPPRTPTPSDAMAKEGCAPAVPGWLLARLAHQARHTLTSFFGYADLLQDHADPAVRELVQVIQANGEHLQQQARWAHDLYLIESGQFTLHPAEVDVAQCLTEIQALPAVQHSAMKIHVQATAATPLSADPDVVRAVLRHVVQASTTLADERQVLVRTQTTPDGFYIKLYDPARPLPEGEAAYQAQIQAFEGRYASADEAIDLSSVLVGRYMRVLGGAVHYQPGPNGAGTLVVLRFPTSDAQAASAASAEAEHAQPAVQGDRQQQRLLVLEDNSVTLRLMTRILEQEHQVDGAMTPEDAIALAREHTYDAFMLDINVSDTTTGIDVLHALRDLPGHQQIPAVACSAYANPGDQELFQLVGFQGFVAKPFSKDRLFGSLDHILGQVPVASHADLLEDLVPPEAPSVLLPLVDALAGKDGGARYGEDPIVAALKSDAFISEWVLRHVNDGSYGLTRKVDRPEHAISLLGAERVGHLALAALLLRYVGRPYGDPVLRRIQETIVAQSLATAAYSRFFS
ncbi:MAG: hypothetical protein RhofKO_37460 [Rhodothermales bacterium]